MTTVASVGGSQRSDVVEESVEVEYLLCPDGTPNSGVLRIVSMRADARVVGVVRQRGIVVRGACAAGASGHGSLATASQLSLVYPDAAPMPLRTPGG